MKPLFKTTCIAAAMIIAALNVARAQQTDATKEVEQTIRDFLTAMAARDVKGLQAVLDKRFVAVEAGEKNARARLVDTANGKEILPPEGNDDWDTNKLSLSSVEVKISAPHPSVAMASFTLIFPLSEQQVADLEAALKQAPAEFDEWRRKAAAKVIADRAIHSSTFAMLARQGGRWKIVSMSFPK